MVVAVKHRVKPVNKKITEEQLNKYELWTFRFSEGQSNLRLTNCLYFFFYLNSLKSQESVKQHLNPLKLLFTLENIMSNNSIIVADGGDFVGTAAYILRYWQSLGLALFKVMQNSPLRDFGRKQFHC